MAQGLPNACLHNQGLALHEGRGLSLVGQQRYLALQYCGTGLFATLSTHAAIAGVVVLCPMTLCVARSTSHHRGEGLQGCRFSSRIREEDAA